MMKKRHFYSIVILVSFLIAGTQSSSATIYLNLNGWDDGTGKDPGVGNWNPVTLTGTLTDDVFETIQITDNGITLEGNNRIVTPGGLNDGVDLYNQNNITIRNLYVNGAGVGISLRFSNFCNISNNTFTACAYGIWVAGSNDNLVQDNTTDQSLEAGIWLEQNASDNRIIGNTTKNSVNGFGIYAQNCTNNNDLTDNTITNNEYGIRLFNCHNFNTSITGNNVSYNTEYGIYLEASNNNSITNNDIENNPCGIHISNSSDNEIYNNNLIGNTTSAEVTGGSDNVFGGESTGGNHWSDYIGVDDGSNGRIAGDGIGDTLLPHLGVDNYPFINEDGWLTYTDSDGDGIPDCEDAFPDDPSEWADTDGDGVGDNGDAFPNDPTEWADSDGDGVGDNGDAFPNDPTEWADSDGDGYGDNGDAFPNDPDDWFDTDSDGLGDNAEGDIGTYPDNPDSDGDGLLDGTEVEMAEGSGCPDPLNPDSDGDTLLDGAEVNAGTSPCNADSDQDGIPDNIDPYPLDPGGTETYIETNLRDLAYFILTIDLNLLTGPNNNANKGRRSSLSNRANAAANQIANANYQEAINILFSLFDRVDGVEKPKDWMVDSPEKDDLAIEAMLMIEMLEYYL